MSMTRPLKLPMRAIALNVHDVKDSAAAAVTVIATVGD